jgi:hypothetical protein
MPLETFKWKSVNTCIIEQQDVPTCTETCTHNYTYLLYVSQQIASTHILLYINRET